MEIDRERFLSAVYGSTLTDHERYNIGTYKEKELHIILKRYFEPECRYHEIPTNGFIADIRRDGEITEIETSGFSGLRPKLSAYLPEYKVSLVYPLAEKKHILWIDPDSLEIKEGGKRAVRESEYSLLSELVYILPFLKNENLTILSPRLKIDEYRLLDGWGKYKKNGATKYEKIPIDIFGITELRSAEDYKKYIPESCGESFTAADFAHAAKLKSRCAYAVVKVLNEVGVIAEVGKRGRAALYGVM